MKFINEKSLFIDSHCHVNSFENVSLSYFSDLYAALDLFEIKHNEHIDVKTLKTFKDSNVYVAAGVHPLDVCNFISMEPIENKLDEVIEHIDVIGETGIDLFKDSNFDAQFQSMCLHINYSKKYNKSIVIHCRGDVNIPLLLSKLKGTRFVFHCFCYDRQIAKLVINAGGFISFSGICTFKNADELREVIKEIPLNRILCETDSPFLAPVPFRGKQNIPIYVEKVYELICTLRKIEITDFSDLIKKNFYSFIG